MPDITSAVDTVSITESGVVEIAPLELGIVGDCNLLLHGEANNNDPIIDSGLAVAAITLEGGANKPEVSTTEKKFGNASLKMNGAGGGTGSGRRITYDKTNVDLFGLALGGGKDFTIELFLFMSTFPNQGKRYALWAQGNGDDLGTNACQWHLRGETGNEIKFLFQVRNSAGTVIAATPITLWGTKGVGPVTTGVFHHFAITRQNNTYRIFADGVLLGTSTDAGDPTALEKGSIGGEGFFTPSFENIDGFIDEYCITIGTAKYTVAFTPPTAPFTDAFLNELVSVVEDVNLSVFVPGLISLGPVFDNATITEFVSILDIIVELGPVSDAVTIVEFVNILLPIIELGPVFETATIVEAVSLLDNIVELFISDIIGTTEDVVPDMPINFEVADQKGIAIITVSGF